MWAIHLPQWEFIVRSTTPGGVTRTGVAIPSLLVVHSIKEFRDIYFISFHNMYATQGCMLETNQITPLSIFETQRGGGVHGRSRVRGGGTIMHCMWP